MVPLFPKIYHIVHMDRLASIIAQDGLWCMAEAEKRQLPGTNIGLMKVKDRRATERMVTCHSGLMVGSCVPFNFCPRSVMLYVIYKGNHPDLGYRGGQVPVIHLEADFRQVVEWAKFNQKRWAITPTNAGAHYSEYFNDASGLQQIKWDCVNATRFGGDGVAEPLTKEYKQAEFLIEDFFPWQLVERIGIHPRADSRIILSTINTSGYRPQVFYMKDWYYG